MIVLIPLVAVIVVGGFYLGWLLFARRDARHLLAISERVMNGDLKGAKAFASRWDRGDRPRTAGGRLRLAKGWSIAGDHHRALAVLDRIQLPEGRTVRLLRRLVSEQRFDALKALGEQEQAQKILDDAIEEDPGARWLLKAGSTYPGAATKGALEDHRFSEAVEETEELLRRAAKHPVARLALPLGYLALGSTQLSAGRDSAAEASFQEFLTRSLDKEAAERLVMKAHAEALLRSGRVPEAASAYEALVADQGTAGAYAGLAMCRIRQGEVERAARDLDRAEELGYDGDRARFLRAQILVDQGRSAEAVTLAHEAARSRPPSDPQAVYTLAYVLATAQQPDAEATLRTYVMLDPNDPDLGPLLDRPAPNGRTWREHLESPPRQDP